MASCWNKLIERQSEVYIERLTARCQVHYGESIMQLISLPCTRIKRSIYCIIYHDLIESKYPVMELGLRCLRGISLSIHGWWIYFASFPK